MKKSLIVGLTMILMGSAFAQDTMRGIKDALARATVRICCGRTDTNVCEVGTAFMMLFKQRSGSPRSIPVFITNKHVVDKAQFVDFAFSGKWHSGAVPTAVTVRHIITKGEWRFHPDSDVDLCAMSIAPILNEIKARKYEIDIAPIPLSLLADDSILKLFHQLDEVVMIGYPDGISDVFNNQPVFRRGVFATNPFLDYRGKHEYLVDIPVYPGSSGSPVLVVRDGAFINPETKSVMMYTGDVYCRLVGILYAGHKHNVKGLLEPTSIPTSIDPERPWIPNNLGIVIKASRIRELEQLF